MHAFQDWFILPLRAKGAQTNLTTHHITPQSNQVAEIIIGIDLGLY